LRLGFVSDLHVDYRLEVAGEVARRAAELELDVLVVAGDVCPRLGRLQSALKLIVEQVDRVLFVPGNHDLWCVPGDTTGRRSAAYDSRQRYLDVLPEKVENTGAVYLGIKPHVEGGVGFVGVTGWYDYSLRSVLLEGKVPLEAYRQKRFGGIEWMDGKYVRWPDESGSPLPDSELSVWMAENLEGQLSAVESETERVVVVTHTLTHRDMLAPTGDLSHDFVMAFLGSDQLGRIIGDHGSVLRVISGHVHSPLQYQAEGRHGVVPCEDRVRVVDV
jgi:Icc-related predicted phosphoesterase